MAEAATAEELGTATEGAAPAGESGEATSAQPQGGEAQPQGEQGAEGAQPATPPAPEEPHVPWARFREARTRGTQLQQELEQGRQQWGQREQELTSQFETYKKEIAPKLADYEQVSAALQANPDIAQALLQRLGQQPVTPGAAPAAPVQAPGGNNELLGVVKELQEQLASQHQAQQQAQQAQALDQVRRSLDDSIMKFLTSRGYDGTYLDDARDYVLAKVNRDMPDMEVSDVPYVLADWYRQREGLVQSRVNALLAGKRQDANLPPAPGGAGGPIRPTPTVGANDGTTQNQLAELLTQKLGWRT